MVKHTTATNIPAELIPLIEVTQLSRQYGNLRAVDDIQFTLNRGEILGFLGPNGAGKTTTMQMISGNLAPSSGQVLINGVDLFDHPKQAKAELGYLPENPPLHKDLTVDEYLKFVAKINRVPGDQISTSMAHTKQRCGLNDVGGRLIQNLSKGYQQRVGIAQAIIHTPAVVILDEPTVGLDPIQIRDIRQLIREIGRDYGVLLSTHILPEVQSTCTHVQIINQGKIILTETIGGLQHRMNASSYCLSTTQTINIEKLRSIPGVIDVNCLEANRVRIHCNAEKPPVDAIARIVLDEQWGLQELAHERLSLEEIFVQLTHADAAPDLENTL